MLSFEPDQTVLRIMAAGEVAESFQRGRCLYEKDVKLSDIYDPRGKYRSPIVKADGTLIPLTYLYDFGVGAQSFPRCIRKAEIVIPSGQLGTPHHLQRRKDGHVRPPTLL